MTDTAPDLATLEKKVDVGFTRVEGAFAVVDERFKRVDDQFRRVDDQFARVDERFDRVDERFDKIEESLAEAGDRSTRIEATMKAGFERVDDKFERLYTLVIKIGAGLIGTLVAAIGTVIVTHL